jgi:sarcosine oxidase, subunit beta
MEVAMSTSAEVVVVGAGIIGSSAALSLLEGGCDDVLLVERDDVGEGTTAAGGGFVCVWGAGWVPKWSTHEVELELEALSFYEQLADEDDSFGYRREGALFVSFEEGAHTDRLEMLATHPAVRDARRVSAEDVEELTHGAVRAGAVHGATYHPHAAAVTTRLAARAIVARFERQGGRVLRGVEVDAVTTEAERVTGLATSDGAIAAGTVVLATGAWTNAMLEPLGAWLPIVTLASARICTQPFGYSSATPNFLEFGGGLWFREHDGGLLWGAHTEASPYKDFVDGPPPKAAEVRDWANDDVDELLELGGKLRHTVPHLADSPAETTHGLLCYTPDGHPLVGAVDGPAGLHVVTGDNYAGVTHGPGLGRLAAQSVRGEHACALATAFAPTRFDGRYRDSRAVLDAMEII